MRYYLNKIYSVFEKQENGIELYKKVITTESLNWTDMYYNEPYKTIVDKDGLFTIYIDFLILLFNDNLFNGGIQND